MKKRNEEMVIQQALQDGAELWKAWAEDMNEEIKKIGQIPKNNDMMWAWFKELRNKDWANICGAIDEIYQKDPTFFKDFDLDARMEVETIIMKNYMSENKKKIMFDKRYKSPAWRMAMSMRDIYNRINDIDLPNADTSRIEPSPDKPKETLFEVES